MGKEAYVSKALLALSPIVKFVDKKFSVPYYKKEVHGEHYYLWRNKIESGTLLLTNTLGPGSNLINPSDINHLGIYFGAGLKSYLKLMIKNIETTAKLITDVEEYESQMEIHGRLSRYLDDHPNLNDEIRYVIEATGKGVIATDLVSFLTSKDLVVGKKATFCSASEAKQASTLSLYDLGKPYDYAFSHDEKAKYCFEVGADAYEKAVKNKVLKRVEYKIFGIKVYDVFLSASFETEDWETVFDSRKI